MFLKISRMLVSTPDNWCCSETSKWSPGIRGNSRGFVRVWVTVLKGSTWCAVCYLDSVGKSSTVCCSWLISGHFLRQKVIPICQKKDQNLIIDIMAFLIFSTFMPLCFTSV